MRSARCPFCDSVLRARFNHTVAYYIFGRHSEGGHPCPGSNTIVPPGAFTDEEPTE